MSFLRCWQLRKLKTSNNAHENQLYSEDTTPPYGQENSSVDQKREPNSKKNDNKTDGKKARRVGGAFSLIDQFKKTKKKDGGGANKSHGDDHVDGRANGVGPHQKRPKVSWDMATASCTDTDGHPQRKESKGSYDYIDADECHDVVTHHSSTPFYSIRNSNSTRPSSSHHAQMSSSSSPQSRYDYLDFAGKPDQPQQHHQLRRQQQQRAAPQQRVAVPPPALRRAAASADEPLYATASSQIYSLGGSEDPYSSIVSIGGGYGSGSATYDQHGYSRIINTNKNGTTGPSKATTNGVPPATTMLARAAMSKNNANNFAELDQLYAKINRKISAADQQQPTTSAASIAKQLLRQQSFQHQQPMSTDFGGGGESGSGSICSSTQPSYRYLTVREDVAVIRERIRLREEQEQQQQSEQQQHQQRANMGQQLEQDRDDAYYSTIGNEYETVGDGNVMDINLTNGGGDVVSVQQQQQQNGGGPTSLSSFNSFRQLVPPPPQNRLSLNVDFADRTSASSPTPLPPTSPIPKIQPQMLQQQSSNNFHHHHHHHNLQHHHQQQLSSSSTFSSSPSAAKVPMPPPPPPPPPPFIRRPVVMPTENLSPSNNVPLTNGRGVTSPKKSSTSALRLSFFNSSPLNFFNNSKVVAEKSVPAPPISPPPKAMPSAAETNGLPNGTGKTDQNGATKRHHSRIPIFNRHANVGIQRVRTPSPTTTTSINCADIGTQTMMKCQQQRQQLINKMPTTTAATTTRDKPSSSSSRRSSPLPVQVGQDYVSTIELSKRAGGSAAAGGGDQRGWPLKTPTNTMTASTSSAC
ncbi:hypothetical protein niasHT_026680 [Heterodera trifolii]|uniref:Uncharacterized protein n=1 Tax=Heterodera trifolii TaxID=157864 RepID=A0ABD2JSN7_9BILA